MEAVTYIDPNRQFKTYRFSLLKRHGVNEALMKRLKYAHEMISSKLLHRIRKSRTTRGNDIFAYARGETREKNPND